VFGRRKVNEVDVEQFAAAHASNAAVIDVREAYEFDAGHVPGATLVPLGDLGARISELPAARPLYVICARGNRSLVAANALTRAGVEAYSVAGGMAAWVRGGRDVVTKQSR